MTTKRNSYYNIDNDNKKNSNIDKNNNNINKNKNHTIKSITAIATITATVTKMFIKHTWQETEEKNLDDHPITWKKSFYRR